jgi:hypothetical protein
MSWRNSPDSPSVLAALLHASPPDECSVLKSAIATISARCFRKLGSGFKIYWTQLRPMFAHNLRMAIPKQHTIGNCAYSVVCNL